MRVTLAHPGAGPGSTTPSPSSSPNRPCDEGCRQGSSPVQCRPLDRHEGGREGRGAHRRRGQKRRTRWSPAASGPLVNMRSGRQLLRADRADRCDDRHGHHQGGNLRARRPALPLQERGGRGQDGQRRPHPNSPPLAGEGYGGGSPPISTAATSAASGASPRSSNTASSASTRASSRRNPAGEIAAFGGSNRPPAFSLAGALKRPTFPSPRCRSHTRRPPMHLQGW